MLAFACLVSCTIGADARLEGTIGTDGKLRRAAELEGAAAITKIDTTEPPDVGHQRMNVIAMMTFGVGWGANGPHGSVFLGALTIPSPSQLFGFTAGIRFTFDRHCMQFAAEGGPSMLLAQTRANNRVDHFGPNPQVTRWYHAASAVVGLSECDGNSSSGRFGLAYQAGVRALEFAPGP
ncbi:MAG TPA: hypothetical protein VIV58_21460 [Kofleriaceae bacterium]